MDPLTNKASDELAVNTGVSPANAREGTVKSLYPHFLAPIDKELTSKSRIPASADAPSAPLSARTNRQQQERPEPSLKRTHSTRRYRSKPIREGSRRAIAEGYRQDPTSQEAPATTPNEPSSPAVMATESPVAASTAAGDGDGGAVAPGLQDPSNNLAHQHDETFNAPDSSQGTATSHPGLEKKESSRTARTYRQSSPVDGFSALGDIAATSNATAKHERHSESRFRSKLFKRKLRIITRSFGHLSKCSLFPGMFHGFSAQQVIAYALIVFGILSECTVLAPRYNVPSGAVVLLFPGMHYRSVVIGSSCGILADLLWLLRGHQDTFNGLFAPIWEYFSGFWVLLCLLCKVWLVFNAYYDLEPQQQEQEQDSSDTKSAWWVQAKYYFPRKTLPRQKSLSFEVLMRLLALIWLHGICGILFLAAGIVGAACFNGKHAYQNVTFGVPLHVMSVIKSCTTLATYMVASTRMSYHGCFKLMGCERLAAQVEDPEHASEIVIHYDRKWITHLQMIKFVDFIVGMYLGFTLFASFRATANDSISDPALNSILVLTLAVWLLMDLWCALLIMIVARCGVMLHEHHVAGTPEVDAYYPNQLEYHQKDASGPTGVPMDTGINISDDDNATDQGHARPSLRIKRGSSNRLIINDGEPIPPTMASSGVWVRHVESKSRRSFLVHSVTGESIWENGGITDELEVELGEPQESDNHDDDDEEEEEEEEEDDDDEDNDDDDDDDNDANDIDVDKKSSKHEDKSAFETQWGSFEEDTGSFACRVTKIPDDVTLASHLESQDFVVVGDNVDDGNKRTVQFVDESGVFLGTLVFYGLQLKLVARFRCDDPESVVGFVRKLRLKDVVGAYTICEDD